MPLVQRWDPTGGIPTSPWKRERHGPVDPDRPMYPKRGIVPVGTVGTREVRPPTPPKQDTRCRFCIAKVYHVCRYIEQNKDGLVIGTRDRLANGPERSSAAVGYTQYHQAHPTDPMRSVKVRVERKVGKARKPARTPNWEAVGTF